MVQFEIAMGIAPWVIPVATAVLSLGGAALQQRQNTRNQRKMIEAQRQRQRQEHEARMLQNMIRQQALQSQQGFDSKQQSAIAKALQETYGNRNEKVKEKSGELTGNQLAALKQQENRGQLYSTTPTVKGKVSGTTTARKSKRAKENRASHKRRAGYRGVIGAYRQQPVDDSLGLLMAGQKSAVNRLDARNAARAAETRARLAGELPPEEILFLKQGSTLGTLANAAAAGLAAYGPYANIGAAPKVGKAVQATGPVSRGAGRRWLQGLQYPPG